jgi:DNA-binding NarL/FixJ family response regulator
VVQILLVEDHDAMRDALRYLIESYANLKVIGEATNGADAVRLARELQPDIVLLDFNLPIMDGREAGHAIAQQWPAITIISMSTHRGAEKLMRQAGAYAHVDKSELSTKLYPVVARAIAARHQGTRLQPRVHGH